MASDGVCPGCASPILTEESVFCHKCGARLAGGGAAPAFEPPAAASTAGRRRGVFETLIDAWADFSGNYYRLPFTVSVVIMILAAAYAVLPFDFVPAVPLISWVDDALIIACALINLLHCGVEESNHSENVTFQRVKLVMFPLSAVVIFLTWFGSSLLLILFQKSQP